MNKVWQHFKLVCRHKWYVFIACQQAGIFWRGIIHDLSKFSPTEFIPSVKYYTGKKSPIDVEKSIKGYSLAWLHHRGRNPHHWEYWIDNLSSGGEALKIPLKYVIEMICDWIGSGKAYNKDTWTKSTPFDVFIKKYNSGQIKIHIDTYTFIFYVLNEYKNNKLTLKQIINKYKENY